MQIPLAMMMSLMQTLKKRSKWSKSRQVLLLVGACLLFLSGCKKEETSATPQTQPTQTSAPVEQKEVVDYSSFYHTKAIINEDVPVYSMRDGELYEVGTAYQGNTFDISDEAVGNYLRVKGSDLYLSGGALHTSDRWFRNQTHLLPYGSELTTKETYHIEDEKGHLVVELQESKTYSVYVIPDEEDRRYGILFQDGIYYIPQEDVQSETGNEVVPVGEKGSEVAVLMYHFFYDESLGETRVDGNYVEVKELDAHLAYLQQANRPTLTMHEVLYFMQNRANIPPGSVAITIDDGDPSVHSRAYPVFQKYGANATLFLICGWEDPVMSYDFWEMREDGLELQSHSFLMHQGGCEGMGHGGRIQCVDYETGVADTRQAFDYVDGGFVYCYPFGDYNEHAMNIIRDGGAKLAFITEAGRIHPGMNLLALPRVRVHGGNSLDAFIRSIQ